MTQIDVISEDLNENSKPQSDALPQNQNEALQILQELNKIGTIDVEKYKANTLLILTLLFIGGSSLMTRLVTHGTIVGGELSAFLASLAKTSKLFYDFIYTGPDFAWIAVGTPGIAMMGAMYADALKQQIRNKFEKWEKNAKDHDGKALLETCRSALTGIITSTEFTAVSLCAALWSYSYILDELLQSIGKGVDPNAIFQMEDVFGETAGFVLAMLYLVAVYMRIYIRAYAPNKPKDE